MAIFLQRRTSDPTRMSQRKFLIEGGAAGPLADAVDHHQRTFLPKFIADRAIFAIVNGNKSAENNARISRVVPAVTSSQDK